jgi:hypothetical protein
MLYNVSTKVISVPFETFTVWDGFQSPVSDLISPSTQIHTFEFAEETARIFTASKASAYRLSTHKITLSELNEELPELERLLQVKHRLRKLWQETRDPVCKTAVNWVNKTVRKMSQKNIKEQWDTKIVSCEVTPQAIWPMAKILLNRDEP